METVLAGIGAILTAAGGLTIMIREFRRRERRALDEATDELSSLQNDYITLRKFLLQISQLLLEHGIEPPEAPDRHE